MPIQSQNAVLNQYVPPFCVDSPVSGEALLYDPDKKTWRNKQLTAQDLGGVIPDSLIWENGFGPGDVVTVSDDLLTFVSVPKSEFGGPGGGATRLNDLTDVQVVLPQAKQTLIYDVISDTWKNEFFDYDSIGNLPDTFPPSPHTHLEVDIIDLDKYTQAEVDALLFSGDYNDLINVPLEFIPTSHTHSIDEITDIGPYLKPGDNVSELINDSGYIIAGSDISQLNNDAGYIIAGSDISQLNNDAGYIIAGSDISQLNNDAGYLTNVSNESIGELSDVDLTDPVVNSILQWDGTKFVLVLNSFLSNPEFPDSYVGQQFKLLAVREDETGIEFVDYIDGGQY